MHRFFIEKRDIVNDRVTIKGEDAHHISRVLRLKEGDTITLCDGEGIDYAAAVGNIDKHSIETVIKGKSPSKGEPGVNAVLYQGIPKSAKMDTIIQKCTELGVKRIVPIYTQRTVVILGSEKDKKKKLERWGKIAEEAAKQSGRGVIPYIDMPMTLSEAIKDAAALDMAIIPYELEKDLSIREVLKGNKADIGFFIGPEGGFASEEIEEARKAGIVPVTLGSRILRTETAGIVVLTCIMYHYDQMR